MSSRMTPLRLLAAALACLVGLLAAAALALADGEDDVSFGAGGTGFAMFFGGEADPYPSTAPFADEAPDGTVVQGSLITNFSDGTGTTDIAVGRGKGQSARRYQLAVTRSTSAGALIPSFGTSGNGAAFHELEGGYARLLDLRVLDDNRIVAAIAYAPDDEQEPELEPPARRGISLPGSGVLVVTFAADGSTSGEQFTPAPPACSYAIAAEVDAAGAATVLWHWCDGPDMLGRTSGGKLTPLPDDHWSGYDIALGPDESPYVLADEPDGMEVRGAESMVDSVVLKYTTALDPAPGWQGAAHPFDGAPVDLSVDGQGRTAVWHTPATLERGALVGRWSIGRLNADGTTDTGWGTDGEASFEGEGFPTPYPLSTYEHQACVDEPFETCRVWQLESMAEGRVLVSGPASGSEIITRGGQAGRSEWTLARLDADGEHDVTWDDDGTGTPPAGDGVKTVRFEGNAGGNPRWINVGTPELQGDRKVLLPFTAYDFGAGGGADRVADFEAPIVWGVERMNVTPPPQQPTVTQPVTQTQTQASQAPPAAAQPKPVVVQSRTCKSRRAFKIRLRTGRKKGERSAIVSADVRVNGKKVAVSKEARRRSTVNLKELPKGRFSVTIKLKLADGGTVSETRRYRTCTKKIERELGPLRTSPPKKGGK